MCEWRAKAPDAILRMIEATFSLNSASLSHKVDMTCSLRRGLRQNGFHLPSEKWGLLKLERFLPARSEFFPFKVCPTSPTNILMNMNRLYCTCHKASKRFAIEGDKINILKTKVTCHFLFMNNFISISI